MILKIDRDRARLIFHSSIICSISSRSRPMHGRRGSPGKGPRKLGSKATYELEVDERQSTVR